MVALALVVLGGLALMAISSRTETAPANGARAKALVTRVVTDARSAFKVVQARHPELVAAATAETERMGPLTGTFAFDVLAYATGGEGNRAYGSPQSLARAIEQLRKRRRLMAAGLFQRVLEHMLGRA